MQFGGYEVTEILVTGAGFAPEQLKRLSDHGLTVHYWQEIPTEELARLLPQVDGYVLGGDEFLDASHLEKAVRLKVVSFVGTAYENFLDIEAARRQSIEIRNTPGVTSKAVAEATFALCVALQRNLFALNRACKDGKAITVLSQDFEGKTVGILGMGDIGQRLASLLRSSFDPLILYHSRSRKSDCEQSLALHYVDLKDLLQRSDILVLAASTNEDTRNIINAKTLAWMKREAILINPAAHWLVDQAAVVAALQNDQLGSFMQDGLDESDECSATSALRQMSDSSCVLLPFALAKTPNSWNRTLDAALENILECFTECAGEVTC